MSVIAEHPRVSTKAKISTITSWKFTLNIQLWKVQLLKYTQCGKICVYTDMAELNFGYGMYLTVKIIGTNGGFNQKLLDVNCQTESGKYFGRHLYFCS